ncbi:hypothetical protein NPIL_612841 [Nephila pilipes]|uniref:Uncharacterized protein n=1 Tax=Nephila pilipes TaxID=299642 RepID=A0A8X6MEY8_NEPPI|nr:hypothetical protein NPIL_612841 [Nephila pilipes]
MSSSDEEIPNCEQPSAEYDPHSCEPLDLSIRATRDASSHSRESSIRSLPVSEGSPSVRQPVAPSALPCPDSYSAKYSVQLYKERNHTEKGSRPHNPPLPYASDQHF